jgi:hypothetical protein
MLCSAPSTRARLGDLPFGLRVLDDLPERIFGHHSDGVCIEVMSELALGHQDHVHELLHLGVMRLGVGEHLTDEVYRSLYFLRPPGLFSLDHQRYADHLSCH